MGETPLEIGAVVEGTVRGIAPYGAFVELPNGETGLVHISEIADVYVTDVRDHLRDGDRVQVRILKLNDKGKYDLSLRQVRRLDPEGMRPRRLRGGDSGPVDERFEAMLSRFKKESEERQLDLKRNVESKRGGRGRRR